MFILDFDDTLFDTHLFKQMLPGFPEDLYEESDKIKNLLLPGAVSFLEFLKESGQKLILLSLGEESFQKAKIDITGIDKFFDAVHITPNNKELAVAEILKDFNGEKNIWLINDKIEETQSIIQLHPHIKPILRVSPKFLETDYKLSLMPYFSTLTEIQQYVEQQIK